MKYWSLYFFVKLALHIAGALHLEPWLNLLFAAILCVPAKPAVKNSLAVPIAIALLYYESWLPPPDQLFSQLGQLQHFNARYLNELLGRIFSLQLVLGAVLVIAIPLIMKRWIRLEPWVFIGLILLVLHGQFYTEEHIVSDDNGTTNTKIEDDDPTRLLETFYAAQTLQQVEFQPASESSRDLLLLHICSLSWDDLALTGQLNHPLLKRFDWTFSNFNSGASYSGPAAIRLLRGNCGHQPHQALYQRASPDCLLYPALMSAGLEPQLLLNHDGRFDDFIGILRRNGISGRMNRTRGAPVSMHQFDGSPVYDDREILQRWWLARQKSGQAPVALYYNTVSLHDGNRLVAKPDLASAKTYAERVKRLLDDLLAFVDIVTSSDRPAVIALVPEHGSGLRGDERQIPGMREIPTPAITMVPVGVILSDAGVQPENVDITRMSSYLDLIQLLTGLLSDSATAGSPAQDNTPQPDHSVSVAENDALVVLQAKQARWLRNGDARWERLKNETSQ